MSTASENIVQTIACSSWEDFMVQVRSQRADGLRIFRGHRSADWLLESKLERWLRQSFQGYQLAGASEDIIAELIRSWIRGAWR